MIAKTRIGKGKKVADRLRDELPVFPAGKEPRLLPRAKSRGSIIFPCLRHTVPSINWSKRDCFTAFREAALF